MREALLAMIKTALVGYKKVRITFTREAANIDLNYLFEMLNSGIIELSPADMVRLVAIRQSGRWDDDRNRTLTVMLTPQFDEERFARRMWLAIEDIEAVA